LRSSLHVLALPTAVSTDHHALARSSLPLGGLSRMDADETVQASPGSYTGNHTGLITLKEDSDGGWGPCLA
jgi:hypothetical protein